MMISFDSVPAIGTALLIDGSRYELVELEDYVRRDGAQSHVQVWRGECATCGCLFYRRLGRVDLRKLVDVKRCELHRQPGRRVRP